MATQKETIVRSESVAREFNLKEPVAREIVMEQTRQALLRSWLAWAIFLVGLGTATWLFFGQIEYRDSAIWVVIGTVTVWHLVGRYQAGQAIRKAAHEKSTRIHGMHS